MNEWETAAGSSARPTSCEVNIAFAPMESWNAPFRIDQMNTPPAVRPHPPHTHRATAASIRYLAAAMQRPPKRLSYPAAYERFAEYVVDTCGVRAFAQ